jgi:hypothetical protein
MVQALVNHVKDLIYHLLPNLAFTIKVTKLRSKPLPYN